MTQTPLPVWATQANRLWKRLAPEETDETAVELLIDPLPAEVLDRLDPIRKAYYVAFEEAVRVLAAEPGEVGEAVRKHRPDLVQPPPPPDVAAWRDLRRAGLAEARRILGGRP